MPGAYTELKGEALASFRHAMQLIKAKAERTLGSDYEVRDLRPQDLEITNPAFTFGVTTTSSYSSIINNVTIDTNRWIAIYGVKYAESSPLWSEVRITAGGALKMDRNIEVVPNTQDKALYFDPVLVEQNQNLLVEAYNNTTSTNTTEQLVFVGVVAEKKGQVLAP